MLILSSGKISAKHQERLKKNYADHTFIFCENMDGAKQYLADAEVLLTYGEDLTAELVQQAHKLKWIMVMSAGLELMPMDTIAKKDILVTNARGIHQVPMSEYVISMLLQVYRQEKLQMENEANKIWDKTVRINEISGRTMVVAGAGAIGQEVARLAKAFQMTTYGVSRSGRDVEFFDKNVTNEEMSELLPEADFVISVLPSTPETKEFFTMKQFQMMPQHAVFLNMGRGDAVKEDDLLQAIRENEIAHAILDVFHTEPLPASHPFWEEEKITVTSHVSGASANYVQRALAIFEKNLPVYLNNNDDYLNKINLTKGY